MEKAEEERKSQLTAEEEAKRKEEEEAEAEKERQRFSEIQHVEDFKNDLMNLNEEKCNELISSRNSSQVTGVGSQVKSQQAAMADAADELEQLMKQLGKSKAEQETKNNHDSLIHQAQPE